MRSIAEQLDTIGLMAAHEAAIAELYRAYAEQLPEHREFFGGLVADEVTHARMIAGFADKVRAGLVHVNPGRFTSQSILVSLDGIRERSQEAKQSGVSPLGALSAGVDLEDALIERKYFEILEDDQPELKGLLESLAASTEAHRRRLREALARERGRTQ